MNNAEKLTRLEKRIQGNEAELAQCDPRIDILRAGCLRNRIERLKAERADLNSGPDDREE